VASGGPLTNTVTVTATDVCLGTTFSASSACSTTVSGANLVTLSSPPTISAGSLNLVFPSTLGKSYLVQTKRSLSDPQWTDLKTVAGTGNPLSVVDPVASDKPVQFYRIVEIQ
jgi:hypothetical protein